MNTHFLPCVALCLGWGALLPISAQCDGESWVVETFTSMWIPELSWTWLDATGNVLHHYDWQGNLVTSYDTLCITDPCAVLELHSITGEGWAPGAAVTIHGPNGEEESVSMPGGELGYHVVQGLNAGCAEWQLPGCLDQTALNYTAGATVEDGSCDHVSTFNWNGNDRSYILHTPPSGAAGAPLVFCMHGLSGTAADMRLATQWHTLADQHGFSVCFPQGSMWNWDGSILPYWNANLFLTPADDVGFLTALAEDIQSVHGSDPLCTYATGASNGGMMAYTLICERPDVWGAMVTVGGVMSAYDQQHGNALPPRAVLHIHGTEDTAMPYGSYESSGGPWTGGWGVMDMMAFWRDAHGHAVLDSLELPDDVPDDGLTETVLTWSGGTAPVVHHRVNGGGHEWWGAYGEPHDVATTEIAWDFLAERCGSAADVSSPCWPGQNTPPIHPNPCRAGATLQLHLASPSDVRPDAWWMDVSGKKSPTHVTPDGHVVAPSAPGLHVLWMPGRPGTRVVVVEGE